MAIPRRTTKGPANPPPQAPPRRMPPPQAQSEPTAEEVLEELADEEAEAPPPAAPAPPPVIAGRRTTPGSKAIQRPGGSGLRRKVTPPPPPPPEEEPAPEEGGEGVEGGAAPAAEAPPRRGRGGEQIGALARRGMSLKIKFLIFALLATLPITLLFGLMAIKNLESELKDEIKRSGYQQALTLHAFGQRVIERFRDVRDPGKFQEILDRYQKGLGVSGDRADPSHRKDVESVKAILEGDKRIRDVAIFAAPGATDNPSFAILRGDASAKEFTTPAGVETHAAGGVEVKSYAGKYGGVSCLYFRVPLESATGGKMYSMALLILSTEEINSQVGSLRNQLLIFGLLLVGLGAGLALTLASRITRPINALVSDINTVAQGDLEHESGVPRETSDEVGLLAMAFNRMTKNLRDARDKERDRERLESELNTAKAIHAKLMPEKLPQLPNIDLFTAYNCAKEVGGDYYDFIPVGDTEHLALCVADVSGKGIPGSMVMGTTRTILRMMAVNNLSAADVLAKTNFHVARDIKRGMFVTCVYAILNVRTKEMTCASAGHNPMLIWRSASKSIEKVRPNGIALGFDKGPVFNRTVREQKVKLFPGDRVLLYTDGIVESMNEEREEWTDEKLDEFTLRHATLPSKEFVRLLLKALEEHQGSAEQHDDITITTFRIV